MFYRARGEKKNSKLKRIYKGCAVKRLVDEWRPYGADNPVNICPPSEPRSAIRPLALTFTWRTGNIWAWPPNAAWSMSSCTVWKGKNKRAYLEELERILGGNIRSTSLTCFGSAGQDVCDEQMKQEGWRQNLDFWFVFTFKFWNGEPIGSLDVKSPVKSPY